jgi:hypothetical protein
MVHGKITLFKCWEVPMRIFLILIVLASSAMAGTILWEYFTSSSFPPSDWSVSSTGTGSWTWSNVNPTDGGYAHGVVSLSGAGSGDSTLKTYPFSLTGGTMCNICLSLRTTMTGPPTTYSWKMILFNGTTEVDSRDFAVSPDWLPTCAAPFNITTTSSDYAIGWRVSASKSGSGACSATFDVDTIHIASVVDAVEPVSLGRIKGAFH